METVYSASPATITVPYSASSGAWYSNATVTWQIPAAGYTIRKVELALTLGNATTCRLYAYHPVSGQSTLFLSVEDYSAAAGEMRCEVPASRYSHLSAGESDRVTIRVGKLSSSAQVYRDMRLIVTYVSDTDESAVTVETVTAGTAQTVTMVNADATAWHRVTWRYAGGSVTSGAVTVPSDGTGTSAASWAVPSADLAALYAANTQSGTAVGTVTVETMTADGRSVGSTQYTAYLTIPQNADTLPVITLAAPVPVYTDATGTDWAAGHAGGFLQNHTSAGITPTASARAGASVTGIRMESTDGSRTGASGTQTQIPILTAGTWTVTATVTDSRGFTATATAVITVTACPVPAIASIGTARCDSGGAADDEGRWALAVWTASAEITKWGWTAYEAGDTASVVAGGTVTLSPPAASGSGTVGAGLLDPEKSYLIRVTVEDAFGQTAEAWAEIGTSLYTIHRMTGGKGVAFGKASERVGVEVAEGWPFRVHGEEILRLILERTRPVGSAALSFDEGWDPNAAWPWTEWGLAGTLTIGGEAAEVWVRSH